ELLTQAGGSINRIGIKTFYIQAGAKYVSGDCNVYIAMAQTLRNRINDNYWKKFLSSIDLIIIDEAHLQDFNYIFESGVADNKFLLGVTATPNRSGKQRQLGLDYETLIETVSVKRLIRDGYLVNCDYYGCGVPDMSEVGYNRMKGDYQESSMFKAFNSSKLYAGVVRNWSNICPGTKTLVFCCNIQHAIKTCREFNDNGIKAKFLTSKVTKPKYPKKETEGNMVIYNDKMEAYSDYCENYYTYSGERDVILEEFHNGDFTILVNASILTTGFDEPSIETVIINRATMSAPLWLQMLGRGSRIYNSKTHFNILDFGDNQSRLGSYTEDKDWSLWHEESKGGGVAPIKRCGFDSKDRPIYAENSRKRLDLFNTEKLDGCGRFIHAGLNICPFCGFKYPEKELKDVDLENIYFDEKNLEWKKAKPISQMSDEELMDYCTSKGHKRAWLWRQVYMRGSYNLGHKGGLDRIGKQAWSAKEIVSAIKYCGRFS
ncbi:MAG TPA: helicase-related protein, partial [Mariniphaga sp.]|nr:helicase-related protein [Mariniphaga sp.]